MRLKLKKYRENGGFNGREYQLYALFSLSTMARVNAVANLRWEQIDFNQRICEKVLEKELENKKAHTQYVEKLLDNMSMSQS